MKKFISKIIRFAEACVLLTTVYTPNIAYAEDPAANQAAIAAEAVQKHNVFAENSVTAETGTEFAKEIAKLPDAAFKNGKSNRLIAENYDGGIKYGDISILSFSTPEEAEQKLDSLKDEKVSYDTEYKLAENKGKDKNTAKITTAEKELDTSDKLIRERADKDNKKIVALIDTGVNGIADAYFNLTDDKNISKNEDSKDVEDIAHEDKNGHGTRITDQIITDSSAMLLSIKAIKDDGTGSLSTLIAAMDYAADQKADVIVIPNEAYIDGLKSTIKAIQGQKITVAVEGDAPDKNIQSWKDACNSLKPVETHAVPEQSAEPAADMEQAPAAEVKAESTPDPVKTAEPAKTPVSADDLEKTAQSNETDKQAEYTDDMPADAEVMPTPSASAESEYTTEPAETAEPISKSRSTASPKTEKKTLKSFFKSIIRRAETTAPVMDDTWHVVNADFQWKVNSDGVLTIAPVDGQTAGYLPNINVEADVPWSDYRPYITSIVTQGTIHTNTYARWMFRFMQKLTDISKLNLDTSKTTDMMRMFDGDSALENVDLSGWNLSHVTTTDNMFCNCGALKTVTLGSNALSSNRYFTGMFACCRKLTSVDSANWNLGNAVNVSAMFRECNSLETLDVSDWNTKTITDFGSMFSNAVALKTIDVSKWDTSSARNMSSMFQGCNSLTAIDVSNWNISNVTNISWMFAVNLGTYAYTDEKNAKHYKPNSSPLTVLDVSKWDTSKIENMSSVFSGQNSLTTLDVSKWNTSSTVNMASMFKNCYNVSALDVSNFNTANVIDMSNMFNMTWYDGNGSHTYTSPKFTELKVDNWDTSKVTNMCGMFAGCYSLPALNVSGFNTANVKDMSYMFKFCGSLAELNVSNFNTSNVTNMEDMFGYCANIKTLAVDNWNTSNVTNMKFVFEFCKNLTDLNVVNWDTANVNNFTGTFCNCSSVKELDVSNWNTANATTMEVMFSHCTAVKKLDLRNWDTSHVTNMGGMFHSDEGLTELDFGSCDTSHVLNMWAIFYNNINLRTLDLSNFSMASVQYIEPKRDDKNNITNIGSLYTFNYMFSGDHFDKLITSPNTNFKMKTNDGSNVVSPLGLPSPTSLPNSTGKWKRLSDGVTYEIHDLATLSSDQIAGEWVPDTPYYYLHFNANADDVTLSSNETTSTVIDGISHTNTVKVKYDSTSYSTDNYASKAGYDFKGWFTSAEGGEQVYGADGDYVTDTGYWADNKNWVWTGTTDDNGVFHNAVDGTIIELYGHWERQEYNIDIDYNGGEPVDNPKTFNIESDDITINNPTVPPKPGYHFAGWRADCGQNPFEAVSKYVIQHGSHINSSGDSIHLVAAWEPNTYKATLVNNGGAGRTSEFWWRYEQKSATNAVLKFANYIQPGPDSQIQDDSSVHSEYGLSDIITATGGNTSASAKINTIGIDANKTYIWYADIISPQDANVTVTLETYGPKSPADTEALRSVSLKSVKANQWSRLYISASNKDTTGTIGVGVTISLDTPKWEMKNVTQMQGDDPVEYYADADCANSLDYQRPSKAGYDFDSYGTVNPTAENKYDNGTVYADWHVFDSLKDDYAEDVNLYAKYTPYTYTIRFDANAEDGHTGDMKNINMTYDTPASLTDDAFVRRGYEFTGWNTKADGSGTAYKDGEKINILPSKNYDTVDLYAQWKNISSYIVTIPTKIQYKNVDMGHVKTQDTYDVTVTGQLKQFENIQVTADKNIKLFYNQHSLDASCAQEKTLWRGIDTDDHGNLNDTSKDTVQITGEADGVGEYSGNIAYTVEQIREEESQTAANTLVKGSDFINKLNALNSSAVTFKHASAKPEQTVIDSAVDIDTDDTVKNVYMWDSGNGNIEWWSDSKTVYANKDASYMFAGSDSNWRAVSVGNSLIDIDLRGLNFSNTENMMAMFRMNSNSDPKLAHINLTGFDTSDVTDMSWMFAYCKNITSVDLSSFNTSKVKSINNMFMNCDTLETIDISHFDLSSLNNDDSGNYSGFYSIFSNCTNLKEVIMNGINASNVGTFHYAFGNCSSLESIDLSDVNASVVRDVQGMFYDCKSLKRVDLSGISTDYKSSDSIVYHDTSMLLYDCTNLEYLKLGKHWLNYASTDNYHKQSTFPVSMKDESGKVYAAGDKIPDGAGVYIKA